MAATATVDEVIARTETVEIDPKTGVALESQNGAEKENGVEFEEANGVKCENGAKPVEEPKEEEANGEKDGEVNGQVKEEKVALEVEPKTFPVKLDDGKLLNCIGLRKKSMLGLGIKIYGFGVYADNEKLKDLLKSKIGKSPAKPTKEMFQLAIDGDFAMMVRMVIVYSGLTMSMVRKSFDEGLGASIKKLTGGKKNEDLTNKVLGQASDDIKLTSGSVIEISRLPGHVLQAKVMGEIVSKVESELLCRAYIHMYLGDDPFDKEAKEKFGMSLLSLF
ncbi:fatty-acid-binding protein 1 isoform X1 [Morus notabilis]|uniref:fatty-acid-binding protein 1 isoform X1 n=1 Tax=Morus notabilis TaxID=981085 RepID=UPI000CECE3A7|nr:fatty-acid-binding protein 1 isoform X1 [Morus notabilis]